MVAASVAPHDDPLEAFGKEHDWPVFRGAQHDVLERFYRAAQEANAECVVRLSANHPFVDPELIDQAVEAIVQHPGRIDYCSNTLEPQTYPQGMQVEAFTQSSLAQLRLETTLPQWRSEVTTGYLHQMQRERLCSLRNEDDISHLNWAVETPDDLEFVATVFDYFGHDGFSVADVLDLLAKRPHWKHINSQLQTKAM